MVDVCGICLEKCRDRGALEGVCEHKFCYSCIMRWAHISSAGANGRRDERAACCPLCRKHFTAVVRRGEVVVVALDDGLENDMAAAARPPDDARLVAGRNMRPHRGRSIVLQRYRDHRDRQLSLEASRLKALRESIRHERDQSRRGEAPTHDNSRGRETKTLSQLESDNKAAMRRADPSSHIFERLRRTQRLIEELKRLEGNDQMDKNDDCTSRRASRKKKKGRSPGYRHSQRGKKKRRRE